jgi:hypothetical protein
MCFADTPPRNPDKYPITCQKDCFCANSVTACFTHKFSAFTTLCEDHFRVVISDLARSGKIDWFLTCQLDVLKLLAEDLRKELRYLLIGKEQKQQEEDLESLAAVTAAVAAVQETAAAAAAVEETRCAAALEEITQKAETTIGEISTEALATIEELTQLVEDQTRVLEALADTEQQLPPQSSVAYEVLRDILREGNGGYFARIAGLGNGVPTVVAAVAAKVAAARAVHAKPNPA